MSETIEKTRQTFILGMSRISQFWGFPRAMGAIFGAVYLSPQPISLDELVEQVNVTKGAVSTNVRALERLGMIHAVPRIGDRKDYYTAETDFWKIVKGILREREKSEFDRALRSVGESMNLLENGQLDADESELAAFYWERLKNINAFFKSIDNLVALLLSLEDLRASTIKKWFTRGDG
jgi:HTH-type transcriptional regulator, glycine betaine synthesis regulator